MEQPAQSQPVEDTTRLLEAKLRLESTAKNGASWFYWIAGLSVVNSIIFLAGGSLTFIFGLAFTQVIDALASIIESELGMSRPGMITFVALALDLAVAAVFAAIGYVARKRHRTVYIIGIGLYGADALVSLAFADWLGILFHLFVVIMLVSGIRAMNTLAAVEAGTASLATLSQLETLRPQVGAPKRGWSSATRNRFRTVVIVILLGFAVFITVMILLEPN